MKRELVVIELLLLDNHEVDIEADDSVNHGSDSDEEQEGDDEADDQVGATREVDE